MLDPKLKELDYEIFFIYQMIDEFNFKIEEIKVQSNQLSQKIELPTPLILEQVKMEQLLEEMVVDLTRNFYTSEMEQKHIIIDINILEQKIKTNLEMQLQYDESRELMKQELEELQKKLSLLDRDKRWIDNLVKEKTSKRRGISRQN
jgi:hypothetical protein